MPRVKGAAEVKRRFRKLPREIFGAVDEVLENDALELLGRGNALVPELTRDLLLSGNIETKRRGGSVQFVIFYDEPYAVRRHEDEYNLGPVSSVKSGTQDGPVGRKYLSRPFENMKRRIINRDVPRAILRGAKRVKGIR